MGRLCPSQTLLINYSETDLRARKIIINYAHAIKPHETAEKRDERDGDDNGKRQGLLYEIVREE